LRISPAHAEEGAAAASGQLRRQRAARRALGSEPVPRRLQPAGARRAAWSCPNGRRSG